MAGQDHIALVDQDRSCEAERLNGAGDLPNLLLGMEPSIARPRRKTPWISVFADDRR